MEPKFQKGDNVRIISSGKIGTVNEVLSRNNCFGYRVTVDGDTTTYQEKYLEIVIDTTSEIVDCVVMEDFHGFDDFRLFQNWYRLKRPVEGNYYSFLGSKTIFNPYQFKPLVKFISSGSEERLFIADEVGVGKTIETGIILMELVSRGRIDRRSPVLIVCPNSLVTKWVKEMKERFNFNFHMHDGPSLTNMFNSALNGYLPESTLWSVVSIQLLRMEKYRELLQQIDGSRQSPLWNMIVVDEAHHMRNPHTESNFMGNILTDMTEMMLMLSATPLNLRDEDLFNQMHILNKAMFPDLQTFNTMLSPVKLLNRCRSLVAERSITVFGEILNVLQELQSGPLGSAMLKHPDLANLRNSIKSGKTLSNSEVAFYDRVLTALSPLDFSFTRTLKKEAMGKRITREALKVPVQLTEDEMVFYNSVIELTKQAYLARGGNSQALEFVTNMPRRMVTSCIPAMHNYLTWCLQKDQVIIDEFEAKEIIEDDSELETVPLTPELRNAYERLLVKAKLIANKDSKYEEFIKVLKKMQSTLDNPQVIVFSFFVRTLKYLQKRLADEGFKVDLLCGEIPTVSDGVNVGRDDIIDAFERKEFDILLSSEVGGEGLDFQFCQAIINYDLPYNPMRVEQRIGRIDRFGQNSDKILVASMYIKDTIDEDIYSALYERIKIVESSVGELEPILGNTLLDLQKDIITGQLRKEQLEKRMKEIEITVEMAKIEMARFEENRNDLIGDEEFIAKFQNLDNTDFVRPSDAAHLTKIFINSWNGCYYKEVSSEMGELKLSKDITSKIEKFTRLPGSEGSIGELTPLINAITPVKVLFNGSHFAEHRDYTFLPPCGFWTRFLLRELEKDGKIYRAFSLYTDNKDIPMDNGFYLVAIFEVKIEGFREEIDLAAVPVDLKDMIVRDCNFIMLSCLLIRTIHNGKIIPPGIGHSDVINRCLQLAEEAVDKQMEDKLSRLEAENKYRIEARISSLKKGSSVRVEKLQDWITMHRERAVSENKQPNTEYIRLTEARIFNENRRTEEKISGLIEKKDISKGFTLIAMVLLEVEKGGKND